MNITRGLAAEIMPEWLKSKSTRIKDSTARDDKHGPATGVKWEPELEKTPLDPGKDTDEFDKDRSAIGKDPRHSFTPKPK